MKLKSFVLALVLGLASYASNVFSATSDGEIAGAFRAWKAINPKGDALGFAESLKRDRKNDWAMAVLSRGAGVGGIRSTPATPDERTKILKIMRGLGSQIDLITTTESSGLVRAHQERLKTLALADLVLNGRDIKSIPKPEGINVTESLGLVREFWTANGISQNLESARAALEVYGALGARAQAMVADGFFYKEKSIAQSPLYSRIYPQVPLVHAYSHTPFSGYALKTPKGNFVVLARPAEAEGEPYDSLEFRPHYWAHPSGTGSEHLNVRIESLPSFNEVLIQGSKSGFFNTISHDGDGMLVASPENQTLSGISKDKANAFVSTVTQGGRSATTLHLIPKFQNYTNLSKYPKNVYEFLSSALRALDEPSALALARFMGLIS